MTFVQLFDGFCLLLVWGTQEVGLVTSANLVLSSQQCSGDQVVQGTEPREPHAKHVLYAFKSILAPEEVFTKKL